MNLTTDVLDILNSIKINFSEIIRLNKRFSVDTETPAESGEDYLLLIEKREHIVDDCIKDYDLLKSPKYKATFEEVKSTGEASALISEIKELQSEATKSNEDLNLMLNEVKALMRQDLKKYNDAKQTKNIYNNIIESEGQYLNKTH